MAITSIRVSVKRLIALKKYENVTYEVEATASVNPGEYPAKVYEDTLAFCQARILAEMERMERGEPPKLPTNPLNEDYVPDFKPSAPIPQREADDAERNAR